MSYYDYDHRSYQRPRHDSSYARSRDTDAYSRHAAPRDYVDADQLAAMRNSVKQPASSSSSYGSHEPRYGARAAPPALPKRSSAQPPYRDARRSRWPPSPSVEEETASLAKEVPSSVGSGDEDGEAVSRGSVDQYPIIEEIEQPKRTFDNDERRFVLVTDPGADDGSANPPRERRRKSFAERGNMPYLKTDINNDPPVYTERTSTPYAYTKPQKESIAPSSEYLLSPETIAPNKTSVPRSVPARETWDQNAKPPKPTIPVHSRYDSFTQSPRTPKNDVFDDSDAEVEDTNRLRTERKPARYSFVKSDLQREDFRTNLSDTQTRSEPKRHDSSRSHIGGRDKYDSASSGSSKGPSPRSQSPRSSTSSLNGGSRKPRPAPVETDYPKSSRYPDSRPTTRPSSPSYRDAPSSPPRSPKLPPRRPASPATSRPSSRAGTRPPSPLSSSATFPTQSSNRVPVTEADWHATYPPPTANDKPPPSSRYGRHETIPVPMPRIDVQSPSPARPARNENPLPYPVDDRPTDVYMPPEEQYQYDHSQTPTAASPRQPYPDSPKLSPRPTMNSRHTGNPEELPRVTRVRSNSMRSQSSHDGRRERTKTANALSLDRPLPSCPRPEPSARYDDWYILENRPDFDVCPSCYEGVFADTPFSVYFSQNRRIERPRERFCDFSSPWLRLAWLLTIKQRRQSPDLLYALADVMERERPCPKDREISTDRLIWYGIPDQRDGVHVANFAVCSCDAKMIEALFPSIRGYLTELPATGKKHLCSLRVSSKRFPKYLDLLVELDAEAQLLGQRPNMARFIQLARENAFKGECARDKSFSRKAWHYIPNLPELTVCEECYDELIWPAISSKSSSVPNTIPRLFNKTIQLNPMEEPELGSSCCLYSPRMRKIWDIAVRDQDFRYLKKEAIERRYWESKLTKQRKSFLAWMDSLERGSREWERAREALKDIEYDWSKWE